DRGNTTLTEKISQILQQANKKTPVILSSSIQVERDNPYGKSKLGGEQALVTLHQAQGNPVYICRLANVFGKWSRPNYNSAVATFCHNVANDLPLQIHDENAVIRLVYVDDVVETFWNILNGQQVEQFFQVEPEYQITVGDLAKVLNGFKASRD
ncbi:NAD-dependent epimerase/dehydratase family protein, partial [Acinetobacter baumannii]|nr:NAD-dependent epimerase/dehydratase family protein [Acinetobacter baumannii]